MVSRKYVKKSIKSKNSEVERLRKRREDLVRSLNFHTCMEDSERQLLNEAAEAEIKDIDERLFKIFYPKGMESFLSSAAIKGVPVPKCKLR